MISSIVYLRCVSKELFNCSLLVWCFIRICELKSFELNAIDGKKHTKRESIEKRKKASSKQQHNVNALP